MIKFSAHKTWFGHSGLFLLCLQLFLFIFCLYPFQSGTWFNTEPAMVALFSLSALSALWLALGIKKHWLVLGPPIHPLLYGLLAWAGLQFFALPTTSNPFHSWMGIPQTGEGGAWHVMLAALTFFAMPLWQVKAYQRILIPVGLSSLCIMAYLHFNPYMFCHLYSNYKENNPATPANFPDYLPFIAGWLWIAYASKPAYAAAPFLDGNHMLHSYLHYRSPRGSAPYLPYVHSNEHSATFATGTEKTRLDSKNNLSRESMVFPCYAWHAPALMLGSYQPIPGIIPLQE
jgi:hypothetical protein